MAKTSTGSSSKQIDPAPSVSINRQEITDAMADAMDPSDYGASPPDVDKFITNLSKRDYVIRRVKPTVADLDAIRERDRAWTALLPNDLGPAQRDRHVLLEFIDGAVAEMELLREALRDEIGHDESDCASGGYCPSHRLLSASTALVVVTRLRQLLNRLQWVAGSSMPWPDVVQKQIAQILAEYEQEP